MAPPAPVKLKCHTEFSTCGLGKGTAMRADLFMLFTVFEGGGIITKSAAEVPEKLPGQRKGTIIPDLQPKHFVESQAIKKTTN